MGGAPKVWAAWFGSGKRLGWGALCILLWVAPAVAAAAPAAGAVPATSPAAAPKAAPLREQPGLTRQALLRTLKGDPQNLAAMRGLLWVLIEQQDFPALARALVRFAAAAARDAQLWRGYAAGLTLLGRYAEALPWFARGARRVPRPAVAGTQARLWLADWVYALTRCEQEPAARRIRRLALAELQSFVQGPLPPLQPRRRGLPRGATPRQQLAALTLSKLRGWQFDREFHSGRLARLRSPAEADEAIAEALSDDEDEDTAAESAARREPQGEDTAAEDAADGAAADPDEEDDDEDAHGTTPSSQPSLRRPEHLLTAALAYELHSLGGLLFHATLASLSVSVHRFEVGLRTSYTYLDTSRERIGFADPSLVAGELDVAAFVRFRPRAGLFEAMVGGNLRSELSIPYGALRGLYYVGRGVSLLAEVSLNQISDDTLGIRVLGARDRVMVGAAFEPLRQLYLYGELDLHSYWSRHREPLGDGLMAYAEAGYRSHFGLLAWEVRASGFYETNRLPSDLPDDVCDRLRDACENTGVDDLLLHSFAMIGGGPRLRYGVPSPGMSGGGSGKFFITVDGWLGALLNSETAEVAAGRSGIGFDLQLGLGLLLPRRAGRLSLSGYLSNSRSGGFEGLQWGAGVRYLQ
jgi:hypothetical protein